MPVNETSYEPRPEPEPENEDERYTLFFSFTTEYTDYYQNYANRAIFVQDVLAINLPLQQLGQHM